MPCSKLSINKNYKCDKESCVCIPTAEKPCICLCENQNNDIMKCDDCKCSTDSKCDNSKCICIVTKGADCICVCRDKTGNFKTCDCFCTELDCCQKERSMTAKCCMKLEKDSHMKSDNCQPKCNDSRCTCIATKAGCVRVCRNDRGSIQKCDCSCTEMDEKNICCKKENATYYDCCQKLDKGVCGTNCECKRTRNVHTSQHDATIVKNYKCNQARCAFIPTGGKPCICKCENEKGDLVKCDDCQCSSDNCQSKCDSKSTCIVTKRTDCICVCRDDTGNFNTCTCSCTNLEEAKTYCKEEDTKLGGECLKSERNSGIKCDNCTCNSAVTKTSCLRVCRNERGSVKKCNCSCTKLDKAITCCKKERGMSQNCCNSKEERDICGLKCKCEGDKNLQTSQRDATIIKSYECDQAGCVCVPTIGKTCICICENEKGDIQICDDCKCFTDNCQCKCDDSKCTCIVTEGADCICVCRDEAGKIKICDCLCTVLIKSTSCCNKDQPTTGKGCQKLKKDSCTKCDDCNCRNERNTITKYDCSCTDLHKTTPCCMKLCQSYDCSKKAEKNTCETSCKCDGNENSKIFLDTPICRRARSKRCCKKEIQEETNCCFNCSNNFGSYCSCYDQSNSKCCNTTKSKGRPFKCCATCNKNSTCLSSE